MLPVASIAVIRGVDIDSLIVNMSTDHQRWKVAERLCR